MFIPRKCLGFLCFVFLLCPSLPAAQPFAVPEAVVTQHFTLYPGWNSIFLEVTPSSGGDPAVLTAGLPIRAIWSYHQPNSRVQFIDDPGVGLWNKPGWKVYVPDGEGDMVRNLYRLQAQRGYLIEVAGSETVTLAVTGRPVVRQPLWQARSFNLRGFAVDEGNPPSFRQFLRGESALAGQEIFRLQRDGQWHLVDHDSVIEAGVAYWVYAAAAGRFRGFPRATDDADVLSFDREGNRLRLSVQADSPGRRLYVAWEDGSATVPLQQQVLDTETGRFDWGAFQPGFFTTDERGRLDVPLLPDPSRLNGSGAGVLRITDDRGGRLWLPVDALAFTEAVAQSKRAPEHHGLWLGWVTIQQVGHQLPVGEGETALEPVGRPLQLRLMVHVDDQGRARLLKQVIHMWRQARVEAVNDPINNSLDRMQVVAPGESVLLTDESLIDTWFGVGLSDGERVGVRYSAVGFDFDPSPGGIANTLMMDGSFGTAGDQLTAALHLGATHPTNPFYHLYHPDHDQRDPQFLAYPTDGNGLPRVAESFAVTRALTFDFAAEPFDGAVQPGWGATHVGGSYRETLNGLHKNPITIAGRFFLQRINDSAVLNPPSPAEEEPSR